QDQHERFSKAMTPHNVDGLPLEEGLQQIGERFLRGLLAPDNLAFYRIVVGEVRKFPQHLQKYSGSGADRVRSVVTSFVKASGVALSDEEREVSYLLEIWRSRHHYRALVDESYVVDEAELRAHVADGVRFFLQACGKAGS